MAEVGPGERRKGVNMECQICRDLQQAYDAELREYIQARSSACFRVSKKFAAKKNVNMERARYELEEHRLRCVFAGEPLVLSSDWDTPMRLRQLAA